MKGIIVGICGLVLSAHAQFNFEVNNAGFRFGILGSEVVNVGGNNKDQPFPATSFSIDAIPSVPIPNISMPNMGDPFAPIGQITNLIEHKTQQNYFSRSTSGPVPTQPPQNQGLQSAGMGNNHLPSGMGNNYMENMMPPQPVIQPGMGTPSMPNPTQAKIPDMTEQVIKKTIQMALQKPNEQIVQVIQDKKKSAQKQKEEPEQQIQQIRQEKKVETEPIKFINAPGLRRRQGAEPFILDVTDQKLKQKKQLEQLRKKDEQRLAKFVHLLPEAQKKHLQALSSDKSQS